MILFYNIHNKKNTEFLQPDPFYNWYFKGKCFKFHFLQLIFMELHCLLQKIKTLTDIQFYNLKQNEFSQRILLKFTSMFQLTSIGKILKVEGFEIEKHLFVVKENMPITFCNDCI